MQPFLPVRTRSRVIPPLSSLGLTTGVPYETAFESFYWMAFWPLVSNARRWVKRMDGEDVVQDLFLFFWCRKDDGEQRLRVWEDGVGLYLIKVLRTRCLRLLYRKRNEKKYIEAQQPRVDAGVTQEPSWGAIVPECRIMDAARLAAVDQLPRRQREIYLLHKVELMTDSSIADRLGLALLTVQTHLKRARKAIRPFDYERNLPAHLLPAPR